MGYRFCFVDATTGKRRSVAVKTPMEAIRARQDLATWEGARKYYACADAGDVMQTGGGKVAHVSYNGALWFPKPLSNELRAPEGNPAELSFPFPAFAKEHYASVPQ